MTDSAPLPLAGLRVVEIASEISGPYAGKLLVDAGAEVIKVEPPGGDPMRRWTASGHPITGDEDGALFQYLNASKKSVVLDLESDAGRADLIRLASASDLLIEDLGPGGLADLGLAAAIQNARPELSIVSLSAWGGEGPDARRPATEFTQQAAAGSIAYRGLRDRAPVAAGGRLGEWALGVFAAVGALTASGMARASGRGQIVDASRFEAMLLCLTVYHDLDGQWNADPLPRSIEIPSIERAKDGWVGFCTVTGQQWVDLCTLMGRSDVGENQDYLAAMKRMDDMDFIKGVIEGWTLEHTIDEILELCAAFRIPASPIGNGQTLLENEHLVAREVFQNSPGGFMQPRPPYLIEDSGHRPLGRAPKLGEHDVGALLADATPPSVQGATGEPKRLLLEGLKVVDLTAFWAGPLAACFLADMGADVVKIESIQRPDGMRFAGAVPNAEMWEWSPVFHGANPGKRDVTLKLDDERGIALLKKMIEGADVLIENYSARVLENFGLDWASVKAMNPRIVMVRMPAFGLGGPWRDRPGFAMTVEQMSGLAWMTGYDDMPLVPRGSCDPIGGMHTIFALLLALQERARDGKGRLVEIPLVEVAINIAAEQVLEYSAYGELLARAENRGPVSAPQGVYACPDDDHLIAVAVTGDDQWRTLTKIAGDADWASDARFETHAGRREHHGDLDTALGAWLATQDAGELLPRLRAAGIAAEDVINARRLMPNDQLLARGFYQDLEHPRTGTTRYPGWPLAWSGLPRALHARPAPCLGEHNEEVLRELGLGDDEIEALRADQIIGNRPTFM